MMAGNVSRKDDFNELISLVSGDVLAAAANAKELKTAQSYRIAVRAVFAGAEAIIWYVKSLTLRVAELSPSRYSSFEIAALMDETYTVSSNGKVSARPNFTPLGTSIRLVTSLLSRDKLSNADFDTDDKSLTNLDNSLRIRHRLTHPKSAADMDVTEKDFINSMITWATVLTVALNVAIEVDKRLGTGMFPLTSAKKKLLDPTSAKSDGSN